jgi:hypothetical protein
MVLAGGEFFEINTDNSKLVIDQMVERYWWLCPLRELIMDHGSEFGAHRIHDDGKLEQRIQRSFEKIWYQTNIGKNKASSDKRKAGTVFRRI